MSAYRQSPSRSPYKSMVRGIIDQRQFIEDELALKKGMAIEAEHRRLLDQVSILRLKLRKTEDLQIKHESLLKQLTLFTSDNERLLMEINERKIEMDRLKLHYAQIQDRQSLKVTQLAEHNNLFRIEIEELKSEKAENNKMYEGHINKFEILLEQKIKELDIIGVRFNKLLNQKETSEIKFEEELVRLNNQINRAEYVREQDKEKKYAEKLFEIEAMKKNHLSQMTLLDDEIRKSYRLNQLKTAELDGQISQNRQLKITQEVEIRDLLQQNETLRLRMAKLQEHNRSEIQNIEAKYSNIQAEGTISLKEQHGNQIRLLLSELQKQKWLIGQKNIQIQQLINQKRELKQSSEDQQFELNSEISQLKSKLLTQQDKYTEDKHDQLSKINGLQERILRESESYHDRVRQFTNKIEQLQADLRKKEVAYEKVKKESDFSKQQLLKQKEELRQQLSNIKIQFNGNENELNEEKTRAEEYRKKSQLEYQKLAREISVLQQQKQTLQDTLQSLKQSSENQRDLLKKQNESLKRTNFKLQDQMNKFQAKSTEELGDLSEAHRTEVKRIEGILSLKLQQTTKSHLQQRNNLQTQLSFTKRYAADKDQQLRNLLQRFEQLNKLVQFIPKSDASILQAFNQQKHESEFRVYDK